MREQMHPGNIVSADTGISLQSTVNYLLKHPLLDTLCKTDSMVVNEISPEIIVGSDMKRISPVIQDLLETILSNACRGRIHIRAERFRDIVILEIQDRSNYNGYALENSLRWLEPQARMVGGYLSIKGLQQLDTTISFSFPNAREEFVYVC